MMQILSNDWMEEEVTKDRRRANLKNWMKANNVDSIAELMRRAGRTGSSSHLQDVQSGKKSFGEKLARSLEKQLGIEPGFLDRPTKATLKKSPHEWPFKFSREEFEDLEHLERQRIEDTIQGMLIGFSGRGGSGRKKKRTGTEETS